MKTYRLKETPVELGGGWKIINWDNEVVLTDEDTDAIVSMLYELDYHRREGSYLDSETGENNEKHSN